MSGQRGYTVQKWQASRGVVTDAGYFASRRHLIHGLIELDVTDIRLYIRSQKSKNVSLSFTGFVIKCLADTISKHPMAHAYTNFWGNKIIIPNSVDVVTMIETEKDSVALPHIVRNANSKSFEEISREIDTVKHEPKRSEQENFFRKIGPYFPTFFRRMYFRYLLWNPLRMTKQMGTTVVSSVGMFGNGPGWAVGFLPFHTMGIFVGGITKRPILVDKGSESGKVFEDREHVCLTLMFDHDIMDGAPAARFTNDFKEVFQRSGSKFIASMKTTQSESE
uniref:2-oxoacid dehydrogenase acyltransferase catalytic domain-containing protein n=1 Tax=Aplanochytrium stocchinoi TaxID=215587 RepID=A0A6S8C7Y7_9STRA|mmetsp:Transcript_610/g.816  ORF Transcript_610/g.816 Transcript_610/m.816 type:complete len:278 (-) Transcript_610:434-1267(-)